MFSELLPLRTLFSFELDTRRSAQLVPKFQSPESLKLLVAGGAAGRFTAIVPGWPFRNAPSRLVFRKIV